MAIDNNKRQTLKARLLRFSAVVSLMTMLSRLLGLLRDMVIAYFFGAGAGADAFFLAFRIPNLFRRLFGEGAFNQAFIPVLNEYKTHRDAAEVKSLVNRVAGTLGFILLIVTVLAVLGAPYITALFALGWSLQGATDKLELATQMVRIMFPYLMLISLTAFAGAILNSYERFAVPAFTPVLLNLSLIACALTMRPYLQEPVTALAWGVLIAGVAQLTFQLPFLSRIDLMPRPRVDWQHEGVRRILSLMLPAMFGVSVGQINLLIDTMLASFLPTGSLSWLYYSDRLLELPLALFGITVATVIMPNLSGRHAEQSAAEFSETLVWGVKMVCLLGIPATVALIVLAEPMLAALFYQGALTERDVHMASLSLKAYGAGLIALMLVKVLAPGYFARQDMRTPVRYGVIALTSNIFLNLILIQPFAHAGLALATSISAFLNAGLLYLGLKRANVLKIDKGWLIFWLRLIVANAVLAAFLLFVLPDMADWFSLGFWIRLGYFLVICCAGALVYFIALFLAGFRPREVLR